MTCTAGCAYRLSPASCPVHGRRDPMRPRSIRVDDDLWNAATAKAQERGDNLSRIVREGLRSYLSTPDD